MKFVFFLVCLSLAMVCIHAFPNNGNQKAESALSLDAGIPTDLLQLEGDPGVLSDEPQADLTRERRHKKWNKKGYRHGHGDTYVVNQYFDDEEYLGGGYGGHGHGGIRRYNDGGHYGGNFGGGGHYGGGYEEIDHGYAGGFGGFKGSDYGGSRHGW